MGSRAEKSALFEAIALMGKAFASPRRLAGAFGAYIAAYDAAMPSGKVSRQTKLIDSLFPLEI